LTTRYICIHCHFYQPPRENPWLEAIELEESASPYHDWNERVSQECYGPNSRARIVDDKGRVVRMINNYRWVSFNFGPTLLSWMEAHAPKILAAVQEADRLSGAERGGHGNALAQAYNHVIMPLATLRDKHIQVQWGIEAFRYYFHRDPEGMWLPETAVDTETLEVLAEAGIRFTILSPRQARRVRRSGETQWTDTEERLLDTRRAYRCLLPSGREIALFFYDGEVAREVAFQRLLSSGENFVQRLKSRFAAGQDGAQLVNVATDGETYGHHHRFGEMALAYCIDTIEREGAIKLTNYGEYLSLFPPQWDVEIVEKSSWSCVHGVERWRADCGCKVSAGSQTHQRWRAPLRDALTYLKQEVDSLYERHGAGLLKDPWRAFDAYIDVILNRNTARALAFLEEHGREGLQGEQQTLALMLLEMQRHGQLMFTSCAWFFDDISGLEAVQILKFAARALQLAEGHFGAALEGEFLKILERAESNNSRYGNGRVIWEKEVKRAVVDLRRVVAHYAISSIFLDHPASTVLYQYEIELIDQKVFEMGSAHLAVGLVEALSRITLERTRQVFAVIHFGSLDFECYMKPSSSQEEYRSLKQVLIDVFYTSSLGEVSHRLQHLFSAERYHLSDLFIEEQRTIIEMILKERFDYYIAQFEKLSDQDAPLLYRLGSMGYPIPEPMKWAAFLSAEYRIREGIETLRDTEDLWELRFIMQAARRWGYVPDQGRWQRYLVVCLEREMEKLVAGDPLAPGLKKAELIMRAAEQLEVPLHLWQVQNLFVEACEKRTKEFEMVKAEALSFAERIQLHPDVLPPSLR
jgi:alpha-amylase/alpha-mannosidase (GH57 family)